jgi:hypothetical protein
MRDLGKIPDVAKPVTGAHSRDPLAHPGYDHYIVPASEPGPINASAG